MMGVSGLREAFNNVSEPTYTCTLASMTYERKHDTEFQILMFRVRAEDGTEVIVTSDDIPPNGDLTTACRDTAQKLLDQGIPAP